MKVQIGVCQKCHKPFYLADARYGKGREYGEHPDQRFAPCGHNVDWFGLTIRWLEVPAKVA